MALKNWFFRISRGLPIRLSLGVVFSLLIGSSIAAFAQDQPAFIRQVRVMEADQTGVQNPVGLAFSARANAFYVLEVFGKGQFPLDETNIAKLSAFADQAGSARISAKVPNPINITFNNLFITATASNTPTNTATATAS